ncbi:hypothetical protein ACQY0O_008259 [Thecaphora frezii]
MLRLSGASAAALLARPSRSLPSCARSISENTRPTPSTGLVGSSSYSSICNINSNINRTSNIGIRSNSSSVSQGSGACRRSRDVRRRLVPLLASATPLAPSPFAIAPRRYATTSTSSTEAGEEPSPLVSREGVAEKFQRLGLNAKISQQLTLTYPHIRAPTAAQAALIPAVLSPADLILRAHTGTGKSFGLLLALLAKPRIVFRDLDGTSGGRLEKGKAREAEKRKRPETGVASILVVPSNELAAQYVSWVRRLFPKSVLPSLDPVIQCLVRGSDNGLTPEEEQAKLRATPPHIIVGTPGRIKDILDTPVGSSLLGIDSLRTLVLDEADAILQLPGRFPGQKQRWKHQVHKAPGLELLNSIMKRRATYSGGDRNLTAGLENRPGKRKDEKRPPEHIRRNVYRAAENANTGLAVPRPRLAGVQPLQLVCASATANSVLRHFFGARTGWLRTGAKEAESNNSGWRSGSQSGRWIDLTGLSGHSMVDAGLKGLYRDTATSASDLSSILEAKPAALPASIEHTCVVVDEAPLSRRLSRFPLRNLDPKLAKRRPDKYPAMTEAAEQDEATEAEEERFGWDLGEHEYRVVRPTSDPAEHEIDSHLIEALAFCFASEGVESGLALIPPRWSLFKTKAALEELGLTVRLAGPQGEAEGEEEEGEAHLYLLQSTSARGLDLPGLSHVFLVGYAAVIDAVQYTHMAGRVARIGSSSSTDDGEAQRPRGKVVTLLRGIPHDHVEPNPPISRSVEADGEGKETTYISNWEQKMAAVYRRLGVVTRRLDLQLLDDNKREGLVKLVEGLDEEVQEAVPARDEEEGAGNEGKQMAQASDGEGASETEAEHDQQIVKEVR